MSNPLAGVLVPQLTPFNDDLTVAEDLFVRHAVWLMAEGCSALTPFGTTGEALSMGLEERKRLLEWLIRAEIPADKLLVGTGTANLPDTVALSRHAMDLGCAAAMLLPPFYYKGVSDEGIFRYVEALIAAVPEIRIFLYHIPPIAAVGYSPALAARLRASFPNRIVGLKDSSGDWSNTEAYLDQVPGLNVFPGSEGFLLQALAKGGGGCITATGNVNAAAIRALYDNWQGSAAERLAQGVLAVRDAVQAYPLIPALKWLLADASGDARWNNLRPPLERLGDAEGQALKERLAAIPGFSLAWG